MSESHEITERLAQLGNAANWSSDDSDFIEKVGRKLDIAGRVYDRYDSRWGKLTETEIGESSREFLARFLLDNFVNETKRSPQSPMVLKRLNVAHKAVDYLADVAPNTAASFIEQLGSADISECGVTAGPVEKRQASANVEGVLPLTVLFSEGPIARAYLETMASLGLRPRKIVHLVSSTDVASGKEVLRWLPTAMRKPIAASMQRNQIFHWPVSITRQYSAEVSSTMNDVARALEFASQTIQRAQANRPLVEYSDDVDSLLIKNLRDGALLDYIKNDSDKQYLFTGGGIVPASLLAVPDARFVHVHPGYLPDIRGADCLLWSILTRARASASAFYMAPGIDTGDILSRHWLPELLITAAADLDLQTQYRMAYAFVDPWVRCWVLRELLESTQSYADIPSTAQGASEGVTFHFMHDELRAMALSKLFKRS